MNFESEIDTNLATLSSQSPFGEMPQEIINGARIEAESFDLGGQGVAYYDLDPFNQGGQYRYNEGVDIEITTDEGGGYNVGWLEDGEWLEYTTKVTEGTYNIKARVASESWEPGSFDLKLGDELLGTFEITGTGGWQNWQTLTLENVNLTRTEEQILRIEIKDGGAFNINWLEFESVNNSPELDAPPLSNTFQEIAPDNANFDYRGRIDTSNPQSPVFSYPGTAVEFKFTGTSLKVKLSEDDWGEANYVDVYLNHNPNPTKIHLQNNEQQVVYDVAQGLEDTVHHAALVKRNDFLTGEFEFNGVIIDAGANLMPSDFRSDRQIEVYGDSISAGSVTEYEYSGTQDPPGPNSHLDNAYLSYASILARDYDAELSLIAQGGISLVDGYGYWTNGIGMEAIYDKFKPLNDADTWDFDNYQADLVIVALGQNDASTINIGTDLSSTEWKNHYKQFISNLRTQHPDAYFIGMFPNMYHDPKWDNYLTEAIEEYKNENNDNKVYFLIHEQITPGHPRASEQKIMADTLKDFIDSTLVQDGFQW
ncbi:MAG: carbohydrate-binding protein [Pleurocapsa sp.]